MNTTDISYIKLKKIKTSFNSLSIYRNIIYSKPINSLYALIDALLEKSLDVYGYMNLYNKFIFGLFGFSCVNNFKEFLIERVLLDENPFTLNINKIQTHYNNPELINAVKNDLSNLQTISSISSSYIKNCIIECSCPSSHESVAVNGMPSWDSEYNAAFKENLQNEKIKPIIELFKKTSNWSKCIGDLIEFHSTCGTGNFAAYKAFIWSYSNNKGSFRTADQPDPITLEDMIGYEDERSEIIKNTLNFLKGLPSNNILLYGDRGTGKSSTVKAIANKYYPMGLRILEVPKDRLIDFPEIIRTLRKSCLKFIIFVDDIAFEDNEENYTALKAVLEGGIEIKPQNVLIYATSNRRHIIKEKFSDRTGLQSNNPDDEIRSADTIQEKLSLADRFGITVVFSSPDKQMYLDIVEGIAKKRGLVIDKKQLHKEALKWELWYNGRSPRTAQQFVNWLEGNLKS